MPLLVLAFEAARFSLVVEEIEFSAFRFEGVSVKHDRVRNQVEMAFEHIQLADQHWHNVVLQCMTARLNLEQLICAKGQLLIGEKALPFTFDADLDLQKQTGVLILTGQEKAAVHIQVTDSGLVKVKAQQLPLAVFSQWIPAVSSWSPAGVFDGELRWQPERQLVMNGAIRKGGFSSSDGFHAGENIVATVKLEADRQQNLWRWSAQLEWQGGAVYWQPFYVEAGIRFEGRGRYEATALSVDEANMALEGIEQLAMTALLDPQTMQLNRAAISMTKADLAVVGPRWITPLIAPASADRLRYGGYVSASLQFSEGKLVALDSVLDEAGFNLASATGSSGVSFGPISGYFPWHHKEPSEIVLDIEGGRWERLALGAFQLHARVDQGIVTVLRSRIPLLDGAVVLEGLSLQHEALSGWRGYGSLTMEPVSVALLTEAVGLPKMDGRLSASIPGLSIRPGELRLDGALVVSVFDGYLQATDLRVVEPFGVASHLKADIVMRHLDLTQLTQTFDFGAISGFVDIDVDGLELIRWEPVRFKAHLYSSEGNYPRRISQRAVRNISALGGAGAVAAIQRSFLSFFETFGYREIGLSCELEGNVCQMGGIAGSERPDGRFMIVRGGGVPALDVIGYNHRIDWRELIGRLKRVIEGNVKAEVQG